MAVSIPVECPVCLDSKTIVKHGLSELGKQRYLCRSETCGSKTCILDYSYNAYVAAKKEQIIEMALNGSGIRDTARVLKISPTTVLSELKKKNKRSRTSIFR